jgi:protoheme IX farnesyltransferase
VATGVGASGTITVPRTRILDFVALVKPGLTLMSVLTALVGFYLASGDRLQPLLLLSAFFGTALVGCGAGSLNQVLERDLDGMMKRTKHRPLPAGRVSRPVAAAFGLGLGVAGVALLALCVNVLTAFLGAATLITYLALYTPLKRITPLSTLVGAVPGALPPVMGWAAARNSLDPAALGLFCILFLWQIPHFLSLAWLYRKDYEGAGYRMLTVLDPDGTRTALQITAFAAGLVPAWLLLAWGVESSAGFALGGVVTSSVFTGTTVQFMRSRSTATARLVFSASLLYLPAVMIFVLLERLLG